MLSDEEIIQKIKERHAKGELFPTKEMLEQLARMDEIKRMAEAPDYRPSNYKKQNYSVPFVADAGL
jgi:hypothetical protein